jgi:hypothetical protein
VDREHAPGIYACQFQREPCPANLSHRLIVKGEQPRQVVPGDRLHRLDPFDLKSLSREGL